MAASRNPILSIADSLDDLPPLLAPNLIPTPVEIIRRDREAVEPNRQAAQRFIHTPGPAERQSHTAHILRSNEAP